jgi:arylsulfatase A-like enzyme
VTREPNIVLISADSLRANHLGSYGYHHDTSPFLDGIAARGARCERMFAPAIPTQPSHTTIYTGQHPIKHGIVAHGGRAKLAKTAPFLPELLLEAGYTTCAVDTLIRERTWFARGYEYVIDPSIRHAFYASVTCDELNERAITWMKSAGKQPFFLFIHYWDVHYPYVPPARYRDLFYSGSDPTNPDNHALDEWWGHPIGAMARDTWLRTPSGRVTDPDYVRALYDREIRYLDDGLARLMAEIEGLGLAENTLFMLVADHGESMTEHRVFFDHYGLYDQTIHVPCLAYWPGTIPAGARVPDMLQLLDVAPTLLDAAGVPAPDGMEGRSFYSRLIGENAPVGYDRIFSLESTWQSKWALRTATHKFILSREQDLLGNPLRELYDLGADPQERINIAEDRRHEAEAMEDELEAWIAGRVRALGLPGDPVRTEGASMLATWKKVRAAS